MFKKKSDKKNYHKINRKIEKNTFMKRYILKNVKNKKLHLQYTSEN